MVSISIVLQSQNYSIVWCLETINLDSSSKMSTLNAILDGPIGVFKALSYYKAPIESASRTPYEVIGDFFTSEKRIGVVDDPEAKLPDPLKALSQGLYTHFIAVFCMPSAPDTLSLLEKGMSVPNERKKVGHIIFVSLERFYLYFFLEPLLQGGSMGLLPCRTV